MHERINGLHFFRNFRLFRIITQPIILILRSNYELQIKNRQGTQNIWNTKERAKQKFDIIILTNLIIVLLGSDAV
jgi:hypothetical protein